MRIFTSFFCVLLVVGGVSGVERKKVTLSVMKGDTVTLNPDDAEIKTGDPILWRFEGSIIIQMKSDGSVFTVGDGRFKEKLLLDKQTGSLTITDLTTGHTGMYQLEIRSKTEIFKNYSVTVSDEMKTVSVKEGEPVTLDTGLIKIKGYDLILWTFENHLIARINRTTNQFSLFSAEGKFEGRLQRDLQTGSLIIRDSRTTDSGYYHLNMSNSTHTLQKTITVTVTNVPVTNVPVTNVPVTNVPVRDVPVTEGSGWKTAFIVVVSLVIIGFLIMIIYKKRICWKNGGAIPNPFFYRVARTVS